VVLCSLTFELTPTAEADGVSLVRDDAPRAADQAYDGCRSGSAVERGVRPREHGGRKGVMQAPQFCLVGVRQRLWFRRLRADARRLLPGLAEGAEVDWPLSQGQAAFAWQRQKAMPWLCRRIGGVPRRYPLRAAHEQI
jgi:hypothetical protein